MFPSAAFIALAVLLTIGVGGYVIALIARREAQLDSGENSGQGERQSGDEDLLKALDSFASQPPSKNGEGGDPNTPVATNSNALLTLGNLRERSGVSETTVRLLSQEHRPGFEAFRNVKFALWLYRMGQALGIDTPPLRVLLGEIEKTSESQMSKDDTGEK